MADKEYSKNFLQLMDAIWTNNYSAVQISLSKGADPNEGIGKQCALHVAVHKNKKIMKILLKNGAKIDAEDDWGQTALHIASKTGELKMARFLIKNGANINHEDAFGHTPRFNALHAWSNGIWVSTCSGSPVPFSVKKQMRRRGKIAKLLEIHGAKFSEADHVTAQAISSTPDTIRAAMHIDVARKYRDEQYQEAIHEVIEKYPYLYDAYLSIKRKNKPSSLEKVFIDNYSHYEQKTSSLF